MPRSARPAIASAFFVQGASFAVLVTRIPALKDRFALSDGALAALLLLVPVVAGVGSVGAGALAGRYGSARVLRIGGPAVPLAVVGVGAAGSVPWLVVALVAVGLGLGAVDATMGMQAVAFQVEVGRQAVTGFFAVWSLAGIVGALAASAVADTSLSLLTFFASCAALLVPLGLVTGRHLLQRDVVPEHAGGPAERAPWRPLLGLAAVVTCLFVADSTTSNWSAVYLTDALGSSHATAALAYAGYATAMLGGRLLGDRAVARFGPVPVVRASGLLATAATVGLVLAPGPVGGIAAFTLLGLGLSVVLPQAFVAADALDPTRSGVAVARVNVFNYVGFVAGAPLVGGLAELVPLRTAFAAIVPVTLVIALLAGRFAPRPAVTAPG